MNCEQSKTNDSIFFVLRNKPSTFNNASSFEDIFCVVHDSYVNLPNKCVSTTEFLKRTTPARRINEKYECNLSSETKKNNTFGRNEIRRKAPVKWLTDHDSKTVFTYSKTPKTSFNLKLFRDYLTSFEVQPDSSISYVDDKHVVHSVQTEAEFLKLWKFAKWYAQCNRGVLLLIDFPNNPDDIINSNDETLIVNDKECSTADNANLPENVQLKESMIKTNNTNVQSSNKLFDQCDDYDTFNPFFNLSTSCSRTFTKDNDDANLETTVPPNVNSQDFLNKDAPSWFVRYMEQFKQDIIKEISDQVTVNVKKHLNECPKKSPYHARFEEAFQCENQAYGHRSKNSSQMKNLFMDQKRRYKAAAKSRKKKEKKLEGKLEYNSEDDNSKENANKYDKKYNISKYVDNMNSICMSNNVSTQNEIINNHDSMPPDVLESQRSSKENLYEPNISNAIGESEFRINCSTLEDQMLDKTNFKSKSCHCGCDTENISINSDISNGEDTSTDCNFEIIQKPLIEEEQKFLKSKDKKSNIRSTFLLLSKYMSPRHSSIRIDEDHFTADSNNVLDFSENCDLNIPSLCKSTDKESSKDDDVNTKIFEACPSNISKKCQDVDVNEFTNNICNKLLESSSYPMDKEINTESECSMANNLKTNVNDSHTSYMTTKSINTVYSDTPAIGGHNCQAQSDLNDLTLSFHSHTTSIADNGLYCIGETNTASSHDYSKHNLSNSSKPTNSKRNRTCEQIKKDISNIDPDKKMLREKNNAKNGKHINEDTIANKVATPEPVHILPETLVTGALHIASFAYGTAREALVKISSKSKDDRSSRARKGGTRQ